MAQPRKLFLTPEELVDLARKYRTNTALARHLGVARSTLIEHIGRIGLDLNEARQIEIPAEIGIVVRDYTHEDTHYLYPMGDLHLGAMQAHTDVWTGWLRYLQETPNTSLLGTGDFLNSAIIGSKSDVYDESSTVGQTKRVLIDQLRPLADEKRIDALMPGNHEARIWKTVGDCPIRDVAERLGVPYIRAASMIVYKVGGQTYEVSLRHGTGTGQSLAGLAKSRHVLSADIYITGHTHQLGALVQDSYHRANGKMRRREHYFVSSGSFIGYEDYAQERGYIPSHLGAPRIFLDGRRKDVHVSI